MSTPLIAPAKPKNARSKRAADAKQPQLVEKQAKTAMIVRTQGISEKVKVALSELVSLCARTRIPRPSRRVRLRNTSTPLTLSLVFHVSDGLALYCRTLGHDCQNQLKKPNSISFSKSNQIRPFEDATSLNFWSVKNDASLFLIGTHTKKRPHGLIWARCFSGEVMEMLEVGIEEVMAMSHFKVSSSRGRSSSKALGLG